MKRFTFLLLTLSVLWTSCTDTSGPENWQEEASNAERYHRSMKQLTDIIVHDIFSPPVASRIYVYSSIAGYEALRAGNPPYRSLAGQLNNLMPLPQPLENQTYCYELAAIHAFCTVGKSLIFSEDKMEAFQDEMYAEFKSLLPSKVYQRSMEFGDQVAAHILAWADQDNYKQTRTFPKYTITDEHYRWKPTPPDYMDGIEPHWNKIRPFLLDSATQFVPNPPTPFDLSQGSKFHEELMEVYHALEADDREERIAVASFWDCNPYVSTHSGHVMFAAKKITPGGHWIGITQIACKESGADMMRSAEAYAWVSLSLADGFISCWDEKYRSSLIRPETVINSHLDEDWRPALQTPPFPEHTSGHSVISMAAATVLTHLFGEPFPFVDTTEEEYGLPARSFKSFMQASEEAAISRLYGGIHYRPAIDEGVKQGRQVGEWVVSRVTTREAEMGMNE